MSRWLIKDCDFPKLNKSFSQKDNITINTNSQLTVSP